MKKKQCEICGKLVEKEDLINFHRRLKICGRCYSEEKKLQKEDEGL